MTIGQILKIVLTATAIGLLIWFGFEMGKYYEVQGLDTYPSPYGQGQDVSYQFANPCGLRDVVCPGEQPEFAGLASWYAKGLVAPYSEATAASRDLARGSRAEVVNPANGKSVEVLINDYGPNATVHPDRIIDLSFYAYQQIADPVFGLVSVIVRPI